jgi:hypothetical protein
MRIHDGSRHCMHWPSLLDGDTFSVAFHDLDQIERFGSPICIGPLKMP